MRIKFLLPIIGIFTLSVATVFAQTVTITPRKTVYTRKFKVSFKEKRTFNVTYPVISGAITPAAKKNLDNTINYWRVFETSLKENLTESDWLSELSYRVNYNENGILDIALTSEGVGAYPDSQTVYQVIDLKSGKQLKFDDVFKKEGREALAAMVDKKLAAEKLEIIQSIKGDKESYSNDEDRANSVNTVGELKFTPENFNEFSVNEKGITILYDAGFPHVIQALQPEGRYFFTWMEIKPFIRPDNLLGKFVR